MTEDTHYRVLRLVEARPQISQRELAEELGVSLGEAAISSETSHSILSFTPHPNPVTVPAMAKTGRNDPCPCGSGKKYKHCCLGKAQATAPAQDTGDALKERLEAALAAEDVESLEDAQRIADGVMMSSNDQGIPEFHGISPNEMNGLLNEPFNTPGLVEVPAMLNTEPVADVITLFKSLIDGIGDGVKATAKGNLPRRIVTAAWQLFRDDRPEALRYRRNPRGEDDFEWLHVTRVVSELAGLIDATGKQFTLTQTCRDLLAKGGMRSIYPVLLRTYAREFNWPYRDGYDDMPGIQHTFMFSLYLLARYGGGYRDVSFYEEAFLTAFPMVAQETDGTDYYSPDQIARRVYRLRTLSRFAAFFGLAEIRGDDYHTAMEIKATPLLADAVRFTPRLGSADAPTSEQQRRPENEWQGKRINMGYMRDDKVFVFAEVWMSLPDEFIVHHDTFVRGSETVGKPLIETVRELGPDGLCVGDSQWAGELRAAFPDIPVRVGPTPELDAVAQDMLEHLAGERSGKLPPWLMADLEPGDMGHLFEAVATLYETAPWDYMEDWQIICVDIPALDINGACISVIGAVSGEPGFLLFTSLVGYLNMIDFSDQVQQGGSLDLGEDFLSVSFERGADIPKEHRQEIRRHGWRIADAHAYPMIIHHAPDGSPVELTADDTRILAACAHALAGLVKTRGEDFKRQDPALTIHETFKAPNHPEVRLKTLDK